jgi:hypothetical protein
MPRIAEELAARKLHRADPESYRTAVCGHGLPTGDEPGSARSECIERALIEEYDRQRELLRSFEQLKKLAR